MDKRKKVYRRLLWGLLAGGIIGLCLYVFFFFYRRIPDEIRLNVQETQQFDWGLPVSASFGGTSVYENSEAQGKEIHVNMAKPFSLWGKAEGNFVMRCRLFGVIPLKTVAVSVQPRQYVTPGGIPIGIYLHTNGVLAIGTSPVTAFDGADLEPARNIIRSGDYIEAVNGQTIGEKDALVEAVAACGGESLVLGVRRDGEEMELKVTPVLCADGSYRLGIWVRDNTQGIGTLTYVDASHHFGALGHGINDIDTSTLMEIDGGSVYEAEILSIVKGEKGTPGELMGMISYERSRKRGIIECNTTAGIYGTAEKTLLAACESEPVEVGLKQDIEIGPASIRCCLDGTYREYGIQITEIRLSGDSVNKGIIFQVTDEALLDATGGVIQGMSGAPVFQNGRIVGAVTHVFVNDPTKGYGIFIENMLAQKFS